ncbi:MAG: hypothetical protein OSJ23_10530 [Mucispirillum schaedleri]|nr:hypothetical protein [Mucispirillum schaedleri]
MSKNNYIKRIVKILLKINNTWILREIYRCAVNVTEEGGADK